MKLTHKRLGLDRRDNNPGPIGGVQGPSTRPTRHCLPFQLPSMNTDSSVMSNQNPMIRRFDLVK
jgi:hypothetical protein